MERQCNKKRLCRTREEGRRFELFWWISHPNYCVYILVIKPKYKRDLVVQWAKASGFKASHFAVLWFDSQSSNIYFHEFYIPLIVFFFILFLKNFKKNILQITIQNHNFVNYYLNFKFSNKEEVLEWFFEFEFRTLGPK